MLEKKTCTVDILIWTTQSGTTVRRQGVFTASFFLFFLGGGDCAFLFLSPKKGVKETGTRHRGPVIYGAVALVFEQPWRQVRRGGGECLCLIY